MMFMVFWKNKNLQEPMRTTAAWPGNGQVKFDIIMPLLTIKNLKFPCKNIFPDIMELLKTENIDFIDAYNSEIMRSRKIETIYSYDKHFDQLPDVVRQEP